MLKDKFFKTVHHFFPKLSDWLNGVKDPRQQKKIEYSPSEVLWAGVLMFVCKLGARRQLNFEFGTREFLLNFQRLTGEPAQGVCCSDTVSYLCEHLELSEIEQLPSRLVQQLFHMRALKRWRFLGQHYLIALDGTGLFSFKERHCPHCLEGEVNGQKRYYHHVLDAKLVTSNGLALSIGYEFIDNRDVECGAGYASEEERKQDCELKAFYRLAPRLKRRFPQLRICLLADSLYLGKPVFDLCRKYHWRFMITFKEGSMPRVYEEYESLKQLSMPEPKIFFNAKTQQRYHWVNEIDYEGHKLNVLELLQPSERKGSRFVWMTNIRITNKNFHQLANQGGRQRWKIENQGYNIQKNGGYRLEHAYSRDPIGMVNFYGLLQVAHMINQLLEKGSLLGKKAVEKLGGLRKVAQRLLESLRNHATTQEEFDALFEGKFQIRLDSS